MILKKLKEWIYMSNTYEEIQQSMQSVFDALKDASTHDLKSLYRNAQNIFPLKLSEISPLIIREKVFSQRKTSKVSKKALFTIYE